MVVTLGDSLVIAHKNGKLTIADSYPLHPHGDISLDYWSESEDDSSGDGGGLELCIQSEFNKKPIYVYFYVMGVFFGLSTQDLNDAKKLAIENTDKTITLG